MVRSTLIHATLIALAANACAPPAAPSPSVNVTVNNSVTVTTTVNLAAAVPSEKAGCAAIAQIEVNRPESLKVGGTGDVAITPRDSGGQKRTPDCDIADGVFLSANPTDRLSIEDPTKFMTKVTGGPSTGDAKLSVNVGKASAQVVIPIK